MNVNAITKFTLVAGLLVFAAGTGANAQEEPPSTAQVVALDECDPTTFNAALGPDFCKNITLGASTLLSDLIAKAAAGKPDKNWDFEPDVVNVKAGGTLYVSDQGGEPHTFTEVKAFGGGFVPLLNGPGETVVSECSEGFASVAVAKTRILQGSLTVVPNLAKGTHLYQCCIHPWMHVKVEVK